MPQISDGNKTDLQAIAKSLIKGNLVAIPTETVYGLAADAMNKTSVQRIFKVKGRPKNHPVIVHISREELLNFWAEDVPKFIKMLINEFWPGPLTIVLRRSKNAANWITGGQDSIALRMPNHEKSLKLLEEFHQIGGKGLAAPSANRFGKVSPTSSSDVIEDIGENLRDSDWVIDGGKCDIGIESTIVSLVSESIEILRPGAISHERLFEFFRHNEIKISKNQSIKPRVPGTHNQHYSPRASILISTPAKKGDGFIALSSISTPPGAIRIAAPKNLKQYARLLYSSFRKADKLGLQSLVVELPKKGELAVPIIDRIKRAAKTE